MSQLVWSQLLLQRHLAGSSVSRLELLLGGLASDILLLSSHLSGQSLLLLLISSESLLLKKLLGVHLVGCNLAWLIGSLSQLFMSLPCRTDRHIRLHLLSLLQLGQLLLLTALLVSLLSLLSLLVRLAALLDVGFELAALASGQLVKFKFKYSTILVLLDALLNNLDDTLLLFRGQQAD